MAMSCSLSKPLQLKNNLDLISNPSFRRRPCLNSYLRFHPLRSGHHVFYDPIFMMDQHQRKKGMAIKSSTQPIPPSTEITSTVSAQKEKHWIIEFIARLIAPILKSRWQSFLSYKKGVDNVIETTEEVVVMVEKVAEEVEGKAEELAKELPDGNIKNTLRMIENVAHRAVENAHAAETTICKIEMLEDEVDSYIDPNLVKDRKTRKEEEEGQIKEAFEQNKKAFGQNQLDIFGALFADHDILDCLLYHFTSLFQE